MRWLVIIVTALILASQITQPNITEHRLSVHKDQKIQTKTRHKIDFDGTKLLDGMELLQKCFIKEATEIKNRLNTLKKSDDDDCNFIQSGD